MYIVIPRIKSQNLVNMLLWCSKILVTLYWNLASTKSHSITWPCDVWLNGGRVHTKSHIKVLLWLERVFDFRLSTQNMWQANIYALWNEWWGGGTLLTSIHIRCYTMCTAPVQVDRCCSAWVANTWSIFMPTQTIRHKSKFIDRLVKVSKVLAISRRRSYQPS